MTYIVCIPSYKRAETCRDKTLHMLKNNNIDKKRINVFVANKTELDVYKKILEKNTYNKLIVGKKGLIQQREFIQKYYPKNTNILFLDDDVESVDLSLSKMFKGVTLNTFVKKAFEICKKENAHIWGIYPVFNPFFREPKQEISTSLKYIVGAFYGIINQPNNKNLTLSLTKKFNGQKEDVERTIKYFIQDGKVIRFNKIGFTTKYYGKSGGLGTFEARLRPMLEASKLLQATYPEFGKISTKKTGMTEFKLRNLKEVPSRFHNKKGNKFTKKNNKKLHKHNKTQKK
jgi:hypothetical protein